MRFELTGRAHLRPVSLADTDELFELAQANQEHLGRWMPWAAGPLHREHTRLFVDGAVRQQQRDDGLHAVLVEDGRLVGVAGFHRVDWVNGATSVGYWLAEDAQGRGLMTAAVRALVGHAFGTWGLHRVVIEAAPDNVRSRAVAERLGFVEEGRLREVELVAGRRLDHVVYGLLAHEWR